MQNICIVRMSSRVVHIINNSFHLSFLFFKIGKYFCLIRRKYYFTTNFLQMWQLWTTLIISITSYCSHYIIFKRELGIILFYKDIPTDMNILWQYDAIFHKRRLENILLKIMMHVLIKYEWFNFLGKYFNYNPS